MTQRRESAVREPDEIAAPFVFAYIFTVVGCLAAALGPREFVAPGRGVAGDFRERLPERGRHDEFIARRRMLP